MPANNRADDDPSAAPASVAMLHAMAVRWVDADDYPGVVEVVFVDAEGDRHSIVDKTVLFRFVDDEPELGGELPLPVLLDVEPLEVDLLGNRVRVVVRHRSVDDDGCAEVTVFCHQVG